MLVRLLALLICSFSATAVAYEFPIEITEYIGKTRIVAVVEPADIDDRSMWHPFEVAPPLTVEAALAAVRQAIAGDPEMAGAELTELELRRIPHHEAHWHYLVKMTAKADAGPKAHYYIVLMSGKVIPGIRQPEAVK